VNSEQPARPFGGLQVLFIGGLFQLPPIDKPADREVLIPIYPGFHLTDSNVFQTVRPVIFILKKVFRQNDE